MAFLIASSSRAEEFAAFARDLDPALDVRVAPNLGKAEEIEYALAWQPPNGTRAVSMSWPRFARSATTGSGTVFSTRSLPRNAKTRGCSAAWRASPPSRR